MKRVKLKINNVLDNSKVNVIYSEITEYKSDKYTVKNIIDVNNDHYLDYIQDKITNTTDLGVNILALSGENDALRMYVYETDSSGNTKISPIAVPIYDKNNSQKQGCSFNAIEPIVYDVFIKQVKSYLENLILKKILG